MGGGGVEDQLEVGGGRKTPDREHGPRFAQVGDQRTAGPHLKGQGVEGLTDLISGVVVGCWGTPRNAR